MRRSLSALQIGLGWFPENPGGLDRYYFESMAVLPAAGVECRGLVVGSRTLADSTRQKVRSFAEKSDSAVARLRQVRNAVKAVRAEQKIDLLVSHFALYTFPILGLTSDLPLVVHFHGPWAAESRIEGSPPLACWAKRKIERAVYGRAVRLICLSNNFARILSEDYGISADRIRVIPGGVNVDRFDIPQSRVQAREILGWNTQRPTVLCVRRLARRMGLENLIDAARALRKSISDVQILIAGRGAMADELRQRIEQNGLGETVKLLGFVSEDALPLAYRAADLTVVPSVALEGFGLVAAESLAAGTPVLVSPVGGLPEVVAGLSDDLVLPAADAETLADRLATALQGRVRLPQGQQCTNYARGQFAWSAVARRIHDVYLETVGGLG